MFQKRGDAQQVAFHKFEDGIVSPRGLPRGEIVAFAALVRQIDDGIDDLLDEPALLDRIVEALADLKGLAARTKSTLCFISAESASMRKPGWRAA